MIEICDTWDEFLDWSWQAGLFVEGDWGEEKKIYFKLREDLESPFHEVVFEENKATFDGNVVDANLSPRQQHFIVKAFWDMQ